MINIAICDDDENVIEKIKNCIKKYEKAQCTVKSYMSGEELLAHRTDFQIIFLDIDMKGLNGIETAEKLREYDKNVKIIYVTNFTDYVNLAFKVHAFAYLNKPIEKEKIYNELDEAIAYSKSEKEDETIEFMTTDGVIRLHAKDIYYFEYADRKVKIKTVKSTYLLKEKITEIAKRMEKYDFVMPHKSFTVNLFYIKSIRGYDIFMTDGSIIPLSQKKSAKFREKFNIFLEKHI